jgi:hypothetical protein
MGRAKPPSLGGALSSRVSRSPAEEPLVAQCGEDDEGNAFKLPAQSAAAGGARRGYGEAVAPSRMKSHPAGGVQRGGGEQKELRHDEVTAPTLASRSHAQPIATAATAVDGVKLDAQGEGRVYGTRHGGATSPKWASRTRAKPAGDEVNEDEGLRVRRAPSGEDEARAAKRTSRTHAKPAAEVKLDAQRGEGEGRARGPREGEAMALKGPSRRHANPAAEVKLEAQRGEGKGKAEAMASKGASRHARPAAAAAAGEKLDAQREGEGRARGARGEDEAMASKGASRSHAKPAADGAKLGAQRGDGEGLRTRRVRRVGARRGEDGATAPKGRLSHADGVTLQPGAFDFVDAQLREADGEVEARVLREGLAEAVAAHGKEGFDVWPVLAAMESDLLGYENR